ncbi:MAG: T9SS type A sorting domain-containing protein [Flavobacteriales bacterium]|nr:T9SS type A sorting domain-containing protein [Flavobacteriales bacterium]
MDHLYTTALLAGIAISNLAYGQKAAPTHAGLERAHVQRSVERTGERPTWIDAAARGGLANDDCAGAITITPATTCTPTSGSFDGATESQPASDCSGFTATTASDVWFTFVATSENTTIEVTGGPDIDPIVELFEGTCADLASLGCVDETLVAGTEALSYATSIGQTYYYRTYFWPYSTPPTDFSFTTCVYDTPPPPANDECTAANVQTLAIGGSVSATGTSIGALDTEGLGALTVWEAFTISECADVTIAYCGSTAGENPAANGVFSDCPPTVFVGDNGGDVTSCADGQFTGCFRNLPAGTYYVPVIGGVTSYTVSIAASACSTVQAPNDDCAAATALTIYDFCNPMLSSSEGATESIPALECNGFTGTADDDVWFSFVASVADMTVAVTGSDQFDAVVEVLSGACGSGTSIGCADATLEGDDEVVELTGLTVGETYYARVYHYYTGPACSNDFWICVSEGVGINIGMEENAAAAWTIFPNPSNGDLVITNGGAAGLTDLSVFDVNGRMVHTERVNIAQGGQHYLSLSGELAAGSYSLRIANANGTQVQRLMVR